MRRILIALTATCALAGAGPMIAHAMESAMAHAAVPQIAPVVLGEVSETSAHSVTVRTGEGETMPFEFDSRTVMPMDIPAGTPVRVEFKMLDSGLHLAQRITPLERGSKDWDALEGALSRATETEESDYAVASSDTRNASNEPEQHHDMNATAGSGERHDTDMNNDRREDANEEARENREEAREHHEVADTASNLPLFLGVGVLLLAGAMTLRWMRRRSA